MGPLRSPSPSAPQNLELALQYTEIFPKKQTVIPHLACDVASEMVLWKSCFSLYGSYFEMKINTYNLFD